MAKKQYQAPKHAQPVEEIVEEPPKAVEAPKPKRFTPPPCTACAGDRPAGKDYTSVYAVVREIEYTFRYCKCSYCGNTFKHTEKRD